MNDLSVVVDGEKLEMDVCFIALHGSPGEDGRVQGFLDTIGKPYTSVSTMTSAVTCNKRYTVAVAKLYGVKVANHAFLLKGEQADHALLSQQLQLPVFVKTCKGGSSIGISLITAWSKLEEALAAAFAHDDEVMIEEKVVGPVYTIGVFRLGESVVVGPSLLCQLDQGSKEFFDYETKNVPNTYSRLIVGAATDDEERKLAGLVRTVFRIFGNRGVMRMDVVLSETDGLPYLLEVNTVPGMSANSAFPFMLNTMGKSPAEFYSQMILEAMHLHALEIASVS